MLFFHGTFGVCWYRARLVLVFCVFEIEGREAVLVVVTFVCCVVCFVCFLLVV